MTYILNNRPLTALVKLFVETIPLDLEQIKVEGDDKKVLNTKRLHVVLSDLFGKTYGFGYYENTTATEIERVNYTQRSNTIQVNIYSQSQEAVGVKEKFILALQSYKAYEIQQEFECFFSLRPDGFNTSRPSGTNLLNQFTIRIDAIWTIYTSESIPYYDTFTVDKKYN